MKESFILLTGAKNNAGDYLIGLRAKQLFAWLRPDRSLVEYNCWEMLTDEQLETINNSCALILTGGPALQSHMYPGIYPLVHELDRIKVPIVTMAIGWKSPFGSWDATHNYPLTNQTEQLLDRIEKSGFQSSVRDYHTLNVLLSRGYRNFLMTGCAALYSRDHIGSVFSGPAGIQNITFSLGVNFYKNSHLDEINKSLILGLRDEFPDARLTIAFHHATDAETYMVTHNPNMKLLEAQVGMIVWLKNQDIAYVDLSGSAEKMLEHYSSCDFHIGYRVHAHILMSSISKPSILVAEDGRGTALKDVVGGIIFDGCPHKTGLIGKLLDRVGLGASTYLESEFLPQDIKNQLCYEIDHGYQRLSRPRGAIDGLFQSMSDFLEQLP